MVRRSRAGLRYTFGVFTVTAVACSAPGDDERMGRAAQGVEGTQSVTYEGEAMNFFGTGEVRTSPAPAHRYFWQNGQATTFHEFTGGTTTLTLRVAGDSMDGVGPRVTTFVNGAALGSPAFVDTQAYQDLGYTFEAGAGLQVIEVAYDNDAWRSPGGSGNDRNLLLDTIRIDEPAAACANRTYEAEALGGIGAGDVNGSGPPHRNFWTNGWVSAAHGFVPGPVTIVVTARGEPAASVWPHMVVSVGDAPNMYQPYLQSETLGQVFVDSADWQQFTFSFTASSAGTRDLRVAYDNDAVVNGEDRNLRVDRIDVLCGP